MPIQWESDLEELQAIEVSSSISWESGINAVVVGKSDLMLSAQKEQSSWESLADQGEYMIYN